MTSTTSSPSVPSSTEGSFRWLICLLLFLATTVNAIDRQILALLMMLDHFKAAGNVTHGYAVLFSICAFAYVVAFAINHALSPRFDPISLNVP